MAGLWGIDLEQQTTNPLFLGGAALLSGEGMGGAMRGMQLGNQFAQQRRQQQEADAQKQRWEQYASGGMGGLDPKMAELVRAVGPQQGASVATQYMMKQPELAMEREKLNAQIPLMQAQAAAARANAGDAFAVGGGVVYNKRTGAVTPLPESATKPEAPSSIREWQAFSMLSPADQERYLTMKRSDKYLDTGTGFVRPSQVDPTAPPVSVVQKNNAEAARQTTVGRETGELQMGAPKAAAALEAADAKADLVTQTIREAKAMVGATTAGFGGALLSRLPGTTARDLAAKIDTLKANAGFGELQAMRDNSPTGGALGAVAVQELAMLQATITSLEQAQSVPQLNKALSDFEKFVVESKVRRKRAFDATYGAQRQPPPSIGSPGAAGQPATTTADPLGIR